LIVIINPVYNLFGFCFLLLQGLAFPVKEIKGYDKLFYNHTPRHNLLKECYSLYLFANAVANKAPQRHPEQSRAEHWERCRIKFLAE
jgi:hypothetical protein